MTLTGEPGVWQVTLLDGHILDVVAHGYSQEKQLYVFSLLMEGSPPYELDVLRISSEIVLRIRGG
jgi:hypothetical protein